MTTDEALELAAYYQACPADEEMLPGMEATIALSARVVELEAERDEARAEVEELQAKLKLAQECLFDADQWAADHADYVHPGVVRELAEALEGGVTETLDYISRNNLSGAENNHWIVRARAALAKVRE